MTIRCVTVATLAASLLAALYVGLWMAARRPLKYPTRDELVAMTPEAFEAYIERIGLGDRIRAALAEPDPYLVTGIGS